MRIEDMTDIQITEMTLRWDIEYLQSYLESLQRGEVEFPPEASEYDKLREYESAQRQVSDATKTYYDFLKTNAEHFI